MTKVLIIDDHPIVFQGCQSIFERYGACDLQAAATPLAGFRSYRRHKPDILIVDLTFARNATAGISFISRIRLHDKRTPILVLSMHGDPVIVRRALAAGATGFVRKDASPAEIGTAFDSVRRGQPYLAADLAIGVALLSRTDDQGHKKELTPREFEILGLLAAGQSYAEIAAEIGLSYKTVANICSILKSKLGAETLPELVYKAGQYFTARRS